jgi:hypothetical protein
VKNCHIGDNTMLVTRTDGGMRAACELAQRGVLEAMTTAYQP